MSPQFIHLGQYFSGKFSTADYSVVLFRQVFYRRLFKAKFLRNKTENKENLLQKPLVKLNSNLFRPANFANRSRFGQVMKMAKKAESNLDNSQFFLTFSPINYDFFNLI